jgi:hypothetical protein
MSDFPCPNCETIVPANGRGGATGIGTPTGIAWQPAIQHATCPSCRAKLTRNPELTEHDLHVWRVEDDGPIKGLVDLRGSNVAYTYPNGASVAGELLYARIDGEDPETPTESDTIEISIRPIGQDPIVIRSKLIQMTDPMAGIRPAK